MKRLLMAAIALFLSYQATHAADISVTEETSEQEFDDLAAVSREAVQLDPVEPF